MEQQKFVRTNLTLLEAQHRQEKKRVRRTVFYVFLFVFISAVFVGVCFAVFLNIKEITVSGNEKYSSEDIISLIPATTGDNIYSFDAADAETLIKQKLPYVGEVTISRNLPNVIEVSIVEEKPVFACDLAGKTYILSPELKVLESRSSTSAKDTGLAVLTVGNVRRCVVGENIEFVDVRTYDAITELYGYFADEYIEDNIKTLDARSRFDIYVGYDGRFEVYIGDMENADIKVRFLVSIVDRLGSNATGRIDISAANEAAVALS